MDSDDDDDNFLLIEPYEPYETDSDDECGSYGLFD